jgi:amino acid transporter
MKILTLVRAFFNNWTYPIILFGTTLFLMVVSGFENSRSHYFQNIAGITMCLGVLILIISSIYQFSKKQWKKGLVTIAVLIGGTIFGAIIFFIVATAIPMIDGDHWADDLEIPTNISIDNPIDMVSYRRPDSIYSLTKSQMDLVLYNSDQPGMYEFDFWAGKLDNGTIYLKAFEITQEDELSSDNLRKQSEVNIVNPSYTFKRFGSTEYFKIYEGDWGNYYAARFEVWFRPTTGSEERKLFEKNFKIEGWMH